MWRDSPAAGAVAEARETIVRLLSFEHGRVAPETPTPEECERSLEQVAGAGLQATGLWLDGGDAGRHVVPLRVAAELVAAEGRVTLAIGGVVLGLPVDPFTALDLLRAHCRVSPDEQPAGPRLVGYLGYDLGRELEAMPARPESGQPAPDMYFAVCDVWATGRRMDVHGPMNWTVVAAPGSPAQRSVSELFSAAGGSAIPLPSEPSDPQAGTIRSEPSAAGYRAAVDRIVRRIHAGDLFETNLCRRLVAPCNLPATQAYMRMRGDDPAAYGALLIGDDWAVLSASPEQFLRIRGRGIETRPIKGTRPRGATPEEDARLRERLLVSEKDAAELAMIVDLARNDLGRVCVPGTVRVREHRATMSLPNVHHTYSVVTGELLEKVAIGRVLRATFPPGSITGAPKIEAMRAAYAEEPVPRGVAMGAIGWIDADGDAELSVAIRTAVMADGMITYHAGGAIVADSVPDDEYDETTAKAAPLFRILGGE